jgi:UDP-glucuronate 4-epimerase
LKVVLTGAAGFIGMHCAERLLARGDRVIGIDNLSPYYSVQLKKDRLARLKHAQFRFHELDIADAAAVQRIFAAERPDAVLHLAAQAGVRYSLENPSSYIHTNLVGFASVLDACRAHPPRHLVFASSSSVYGSNTKLPWSETDKVDHPVSLYAATKKSNELCAHAYSHLFGLHATGLRYFTVYGPWGRPDMSAFLFARAILDGQPIQVFNHGDMQRDFTYVDDIVEGTLRVLDKPSRYAIYNIGNHSPVPLLEYIAILERALGRKAQLEMKPMQPGDVKATYADTAALRQAVGFAPSTPLETGLARFAEWFKSYHGPG